jgi:predicted transcriptional regulator
MPVTRGSFKKGEAKGRPKGVTNKLTRSVKEVFQAAFDEMQQTKHANLLTWGKENPNEFYRLTAKLIPAAMEVKADIQVNDITGVVILPPVTKDK